LEYVFSFLSIGDLPDKLSLERCAAKCGSCSLKKSFYNQHVNWLATLFAAGGSPAASH
jgi:hypothetical protein